MIDGTGSPPKAEAAVLVRGGRVAWVGPTSELDRTDDLRFVDVTGKYVIPGLIDANAHLVLQTTPEVLLRYEPGGYDDLVVEAAQVGLRAGITTIFDTWGPLESLRRVRDRINAGEETGSRIFFAGNIIGNGGPWSEDFMVYGELSSAVVDSVNHQWEQGVGGDLPWLSADEVRSRVRDYIATSGIDFVKYASSAHKSFRFIALSPDAQRAIVEEAHAAGMTAQACTLTPEALKLAIEAGVGLLQHGSTTGRRPMPPETLDLIVRRQLPCVAFLKTERRIAALREDTRLPQHQREGFLVQDANDRRLIEAGAKLLLGNDAGVMGPTSKTCPVFGSLHGPDASHHLGAMHIVWLRAAIERGMAPMEGLLAATRNIADAYGRGDELGTIEPGKRADLLILDANPLEDVENYGRIAHVVKDGELVDRQSLPTHPVLTREEDWPV